MTRLLDWCYVGQDRKNHDEFDEKQSPKMIRRISLLLVCFMLMTAFAAPANAVTEAKGDSGQQAIAESSEASTSRVPDIFADVTQLERIDARTTRVIVKNFLEANPMPKKYTVNAVSQGYEEDESRPALKLNQVWVGANAILLDLTGLTRKGKGVSAVMRRDTLRLKNSKGETSPLMAFEGVTELRDRRGGSALVVNPGDSLYLMFGKLDDYFAYSLSHLNRDNTGSVYFDRIDPLFRERYDVVHAAAMTPIAMKDFMVEFASNDPDKRVLPIFAKLLGEMRAQKTFEGYYAAWRLTEEPKDYAAMQRTALSAKQKAIIRAIEEEKQAEIRRREEAKLADLRRHDARRLEEQQAEQARAAEQRCLITPSCRQAIEEKKALCVRTVQNCRTQCDGVAGSGQQSSLFGKLAAAALARACYAGCKCDSGFGDVLARFNQATSVSTPIERNSNTTRPTQAAQPKTFVCTIYCNSTSRPTIRRETKVSSRAEAARLLGEQGHSLCQGEGHSRASSMTLPERQCYEK